MIRIRSQLKHDDVTTHSWTRLTDFYFLFSLNLGASNSCELLISPLFSTPDNGRQSIHTISSHQLTCCHFPLKSDISDSYRP